MAQGTLSKQAADKYLFITYMFVTAVTLMQLLLLFSRLAPHYHQLHFYQDFSVFYDVAAQIHAGSGGDIYRESIHDMEGSLRGQQPQFLSNPFINPPPFLLMLAPLGLVTQPIGLILWTVLGIAVWLTVLHLDQVKRHFPTLLTSPWFLTCYAIIVVCSPYVYPNIELGQVDLFTGAILIAAVCYRQVHPILSGILLGLLCIKPQVALAVPLLLLMERNIRALSTAFITVCFLAAVTTALFGISIWQDYMHDLEVYRPYVVSDILGMAKHTTSFYQCFRWMGMSPTWAIADHFILAISTTIICTLKQRHLENEGQRICLWLMLGLLISPYMLVYNFTPALFIAFILAERCITNPSKTSLATAITFAGLTLWPSLISIIPWCATSFVVLAGLIYVVYAHHFELHHGNIKSV